ncbi:MAG: MlaD family protein [Desulfuromonas thiophila]|nr:MlaD family protein [Desulfuromonas thiophila]
MASDRKNLWIGSFVLGGLALFVGALLLLGSGRLLRQEVGFVLFFDEAVKGLDVGAPVMFQGVRIGSVRDIQVQYDPGDLVVRIPVVIDINPARLRDVTGNGKSASLTPKQLDTALLQLVRRGLRAQLQMQSVVTGKLMVALDFFPDRPPRYLGHNGDLAELPTVRTNLGELADVATSLIDQLRALPVEDLLVNLNRLIGSVEELLNAPATRDSLSRFAQVLAQLQQLLGRADQELPQLSAAYRDLAGRAGASLAALDTTLAQGRQSLQQLDRTLANGEGLLAAESAERAALLQALDEISASAHSLRQLTDYLQRHPEALLQGKALSGDPR